MSIFSKIIEAIKNVLKKQQKITISNGHIEKNDKFRHMNLYYPKAIISPKPMKTSGKYTTGYPLGAVVHFTAGRYENGVQSAQDMIEYGRGQGFAYLCIANDGSVVQAHPIDEMGYHAGESKWPGLGSSVSDKLIGIEICGAGLLSKEGDKFKAWYGGYIPKEMVRYVTQDEYECPTGYYHKYTPEQERSLIDLLIWLKKNDPTGKFSFDYVLGHHEVAGVKGIGYWRKNDPGGALSMPMSKFRELLKQKFAER